MTIVSGICLGPYEMVFAIGAGGMSEMYRPLGFEDLPKFGRGSSGDEDDFAARFPVCHTFATLVLGESPRERENAVLTRVS
jgi:hypothetical protein